MIRKQQHQKLHYPSGHPTQPFLLCNLVAFLELYLGKGAGIPSALRSPKSVCVGLVPSRDGAGPRAHLPQVLAPLSAPGLALASPSAPACSSPEFFLHVVSLVCTLDAESLWGV